MAWNEPGGNGDNHDPWRNGKNRGGKRGDDQGPPDLDEALRKLQDKMNDIFGGSGKKQGPGHGGGGDGSGSTGGSGFFLADTGAGRIVLGGDGVLYRRSAGAWCCIASG